MNNEFRQRAKPAMTLRWGTIVTIDFPQGQGLPPKRRPAVDVQCDRNNVRLTNAIAAMVSSNTRLAGSEPSQVFIDSSSPDGQLSGLLRESVVNCENLYKLP